MAPGERSVIVNCRRQEGREGEGDVLVSVVEPLRRRFLSRRAGRSFCGGLVRVPLYEEEGGQPGLSERKEGGRGGRKENEPQRTNDAVRGSCRSPSLDGARETGGSSAVNEKEEGEDG